MTWDDWLVEYGLPLWQNTTRFVSMILEKTAIEVMTLRFEDLQRDSAAALAPVVQFLGMQAVHPSYDRFYNSLCLPSAWFVPRLPDAS